MFHIFFIRHKRIDPSIVPIFRDWKGGEKGVERGQMLENAADTEEFLFADSFCSEHSSTRTGNETRPPVSCRERRAKCRTSAAYEEKIKYEKEEGGVTGVNRVQVSRNCRVSRDGKGAATL